MDLELCQHDIDIAFLYAPVKEYVHIRQTLGLADGTPKVYHLKRCVCGLKHLTASSTPCFGTRFVDNGWQQCVSDPCIYIFRIGPIFAMIALYVDDIPAACNDTA